MFFEELMKILVGPEPNTVRAEQALVRLLDFDFFGDPNGEAWKLWASLMSDVNQTICGGETLDEKWAEEVIQTILKLLFLTHEITSRGQWIKITNTKISKAPVYQSVVLPRKHPAGTGFRDRKKNVVKGAVNPSVFLRFMVGLSVIFAWSSYGGFSF